MDTELCFFWGGVERLRFSIRSNDGSIIETNRRAKVLVIPAGSEIKTVDGELVGTVERVSNLGGNRYAIHYAAVNFPEDDPDAEVYDDGDDFLAMAERLEQEIDGGDLKPAAKLDRLELEAHLGSFEFGDEADEL